MDYLNEKELGKDRRYMRGNLLVRRRRTRKGILKLILFFLFLSIVIAGLAFGFKEGYLYFISSPEYDVMNIKIMGCNYSSCDELKSSIASILRTNIFTIDLEQLKKRLKENPWVEDAAIKKNLPSKIEIEIKEREPVALLLWKEEIYLIDRNAVPIDFLKPEYSKFDFPILIGAETDNLEESVLRIKRGIAMLETIRDARPSMMDMVSEINVCKGHYFQVRFTDGSPILYLDEETFDENIDHYLSIKDDIARQFDNVEYIDLRWKNRVVVKPISFIR
ncbi:MAG: FtsQ-type POTRA domain-containing protein [Acidobacteriota bacterium]